MSANAMPISNDRFAEALVDLPIGNLHAKAAELRNSIAHLVRSNEQLQPFAEDGDRDCADAIEENGDVMDKMEARIALLKREVEGRGLPWGEHVPTVVNGKLEAQRREDQDHMDGVEHPGRDTPATASSSSRTQGGTLGDEELSSSLRERMDADIQGNDDGVHL
ncbi:MAG: hypothetical protein Q9186_002751 [Xanthomendoza sp. 1 TL-2023]